MKTLKKEIKLQGKKYKSDFIFFEKNDKKKLRKFFEDWESLCKRSFRIGGTRKINLPESFSEAVFCLEMNVARSVKNISGISSSFDCYDFKREKRIQIKASSSKGPTQFGPSTIQDETYFIYFRKLAESKPPVTNYSGEFEIYKLNQKKIEKVMVNKNETLKDQKDQIRRPRFVVDSKLIKPLNLQPTKKGDVKAW